MEHDRRRDVPIDPSTTEEVGREQFKPPKITEQNVESLLKLDALGKGGLPATLAANLKRQAGGAILQGIAQEERKRAFKAIAVYFEYVSGRATQQELFDALTPFEIKLLERLVGSLPTAPDREDAIEAESSLVVEVQAERLPPGDAEE